MLKLLYRAEHCAVMTLLLKQPKTINAKKKKLCFGLEGAILRQQHTWSTDYCIPWKSYICTKCIYSCVTLDLLLTCLSIPPAQRSTHTHTENYWRKMRVKTSKIIHLCHQFLLLIPPQHLTKHFWSSFSIPR